jgi:integrase
VLGKLESEEIMDKAYIPKKSATLNVIIDFYLTSDAFKRLRPATQKDYENNIAAVRSTIVDGKALGLYRHRSIKVRHLTDAYEQWLQKGVRTANYHRSVLSTAWVHSMRYDVMTYNPVKLIKTQSSETRRVTWTREHVKAFLDVAYSDFAYRSIGLIVHMAYDWGQRVGDMRLLTWDKLDLDQCQLNLKQSKRNAHVKLPISGDLCKMLNAQKEDFGYQEYVAPRVKHRAGDYPPYDVNEISNLVNGLLDKANLPRELTAMDLRRTAVTEMLEGGVDIAGIRQVTGHKNMHSVVPYMVNTYSGATKALAARGGKDDEHS